MIVLEPCYLGILSIFVLLNQKTFRIAQKWQPCRRFNVCVCMYIHCMYVCYAYFMLSTTIFVANILIYLIQMSEISNKIFDHYNLGIMAYRAWSYSFRHCDSKHIIFLESPVLSNTTGSAEFTQSTFYFDQSLRW